MHSGYKLLLSIPYAAHILGLPLFLFTPGFWLNFPISTYRINSILITLLHPISTTLLITHLWYIKYLKRNTKVEWTWILVLTSSISGLIYIWQKDAIFRQKSKENHQNNGN